MISNRIYVKNGKGNKFEDIKSSKINYIMNKDKLFEDLSALWAEFETNHNGTTKASDGRARKALGEIKKLVTDYRKASVESNKK